MKPLILLLAFLVTYLTFFGQDIDNSIDTSEFKTSIKELNFSQDTLWVMDSSHSYQLISGEHSFIGNYKVLSRDDLGNKLTGISKYKRYSTETLENLSLDSVSYFEGTSNIQYSKSFSWNSNDDKWMKHIYSLINEKGNTLDHYEKNWSNYQNEYTYGSQSIADYVNFQLITVVRNNYNPEIDDWVHNSKHEFFYNEAGIDTLQIVTQWDTINQQWENQFKYQYLLTDEGTIIESYRYSWNENLYIWQFNNKNIFKMNDQGLADTTLFLTWDTLQNNWIPKFKNIYSYNESGKKSSRLTESYNLQNNSWVNQYRFDYEYESQKDITTFIVWDSISSIWQFYRRDSQSYIAENILDTVQVEEWDTLTQRWKGYYRLINTFDSRMNQIGTLEQLWDTPSWEWTDRNYKQFFWSPFKPLGITEIEKGKIVLYPNPGTNQLKVRIAVQHQQSIFQLYDINGKQVLQERISGQYGEVSTSFLPQGTYIYKITSPDGLFESGKWVKK